MCSEDLTVDCEKPFMAEREAEVHGVGCEGGCCREASDELLELERVQQDLRVVLGGGSR